MSVLDVAAAAGGASAATWLEIAGTVVGTIAGVVVAVLMIRSAFRKYVRQQQAEAVEKVDLSRAIHANAEATRENTGAIHAMSEEFRALSEEFRAFARDTRAALNGHAEQLASLRHPTGRKPTARELGAAVRVRFLTGPAGGPNRAAGLREVRPG